MATGPDKSNQSLPAGKGQRVKRIRVIGLILLAVGGLTVSLLLFSINVATIRLPRSEQKLVCALKTLAGGDIRLNYLHSVERTPVEGCFSVGKGPTLLVRETRMMSVGTGLPNTAPERTRRDGRWMVVDEGMQPMPGFDFYLSSVNETRITVDGSLMSLKVVPSGSVIRLNVEKVCLGCFWLWRLSGKDWRED